MLIAEEKNSVRTSYTRSSMSIIMVDRSSSNAYNNQLLKSFSTMDFGNKYDINPLPYNTITLKNRQTKTGHSRTSAIIEEKLNELEVGKDIVSYWFNRQPDGHMDLSTIWKRGEYNATDEDYLIAIATKRGVSELQDAGHNLIERSYVAVLDVYNVLRYDPPTGSDYFTATVDVYLYALEYGEDLQDSIFTCWIDDSTDEDQALKRNEKFNKLPFNVKFITMVGASASSIGTGRSMFLGFTEAFYTAMNKGDNEGTKISSKKYSKADDSKLKDLMEESFVQGMLALENRQEDLKALTPIVSTFPIRAKIGQKEGLKRNQLYTVNEYYIDKKNRPAKRKVGYVRATKVTDNRRAADGNMESSYFTPISSRRFIRKGMTLDYKIDKRLEFYADGFGGAKIGGATVGMEYINFYLTGGFSGRIHADILLVGFQMKGSSTSSSSKETAEFSGCFRFGYSLGYNLISNLSIAPFANVGFGYSTAGSDDSEYDSSDEPSINELSFSFGATANFSYFYPFTVYFKLEKLSLFSAVKTYTAFGVGLKYAF